MKKNKLLNFASACFSNTCECSFISVAAVGLIFISALVFLSTPFTNSARAAETKTAPNSSTATDGTTWANQAAGTVTEGDDFWQLVNPDRDYLIVVNDANPYEFGGDYDQALQPDLRYITDVYGERELLEYAAKEAFLKLQEKMLAEGMSIGLFNGWRTYQDQQDVVDYYGSLEDWAATNKIMAPGYTEHHTGLLLNVVILYPDDEGNYVWYTETAERQQTIPFFQKLHENLADFGFIDRYPAGKENITGVPCEPYEIRFVGSAQIAHEIQDNGLCLEEYLARIGRQNILQNYDNC